jgi:hypothetical protein
VYIICKEHQSCVFSIKLHDCVVTSWFGFPKSVFQARHLRIMHCLKHFYRNTCYWNHCAWLTVQSTLKWTLSCCKLYISQKRLSDKWRIWQCLSSFCPSGHGCEHKGEPDRDLHCSSEQENDALNVLGIWLGTERVSFLPFVCVCWWCAGGLWNCGYQWIVMIMMVAGMVRWEGGGGRGMWPWTSTKFCQG